MTIHPMRKLALLAAVVPLAGIVSACATSTAGEPQAAPEAAPAATASAAEAPGEEAAMAGSYLERLPPLLDRKLFFDDPQIAGSQLSPDGQYLSFLKPYNGVMNIWVKGLRDPWDAARAVTADTERPVTEYFWSEDGRFVLYAQDKGGNENYHVYAVDPRAAAEEATGVPPARDLTPLEGVRAIIYAVPERAPGEIVVGLNDRDPALHDVYRLDLATGERELLIQNDHNVAAWIPDLDGRVRLAFRQTPDGGSEILAVEDGKLGRPVYSCTFEETCFPLRFHRDGERVYIESNHGDDVDLSRLMLLDPKTGEAEVVEADPEGEVDFGSPIFSERTEELVATSYLGDRLRVYPRSEWFEKVMANLRAQLPDGEIGIGGFTNDDRLAKVVVSRDVDPGSVYLYDDSTGKVELLYASRPELPSEHLAEMRAVRYPARDGQEIPAYLTVPKGVEAKGLPALLLPHGGPWARDEWGYNSIAQFLANRGYAVLSMNFRGSTGYGKAFLNAGNETWGTGTMQHDITDAARWLVDQGIADPDRLGIIGGSYGGYATLAGLAFTPDLYAAGVSIVGPSNIITLLNSIPPYWGPLKKIFFLRVGDPSDDTDRARLEAQSPFFHAEEITAPLLVIQGANDPRVKQAESDQIVVRLRDLGREVAYVVAPDEGHGFQGRENRLAMFAAIEAFFAEHLGGRHQESMDPEVAERLAAMTVDVADVEMPEAATDADAAMIAPLPPVDASTVNAATLGYRSTIGRSGEEMELLGQRTITPGERDGRRVLEIVSVAEGPMGQVTDTYVLAADTLRPISRQAVQGPVRIDVAYADRAATGQIQAGPQRIPIEVELPAPAFGDGAALETAVTAMPLAEGYEATVRTFEVGMVQRVRVWSLEVAGRETVSVAAGEFDAWRVELEPLDGEGGGDTLWVSTEAPRLVVKMRGELPAAGGGGTVTTELVSVSGGAEATP